MKTLIVLFLFSYNFAIAGVFVKTFGGDDCEEVFALTATNDGGFVASGYTSTFGSGGSNLPNRHDFLISKFDSSGVLQWSRTLGDADAFDVGWGVVQTQNGDLLVTGFTAGFGAGSPSTLDLLLSKFNINGNHIWTKKVGASGLEKGFSICEAQNGGYLVAGITNSFGAGYLDLLLLKFDTSGNIQWVKTAGEDSSDFGSYYGPSFMETTDGNIVGVGTTTSFSALSEDIIICKFDSAGNHLWSRILRGDSLDRANAIVESDDGGYVLCGTSKSFDNGEGDVILSKFDKNGNELWTKTIGGTMSEYSAAMVKSLNGGFVITGGTTSFGSIYSDFLITEFDSAGNHIWTRTLRLGTTDTRNFGKSIARLSDGSYLVSGEITVPFMPEIPLIKIGSNGELCMGLYQNLTSNVQFPTIINVTPMITTPTFNITNVNPIVTSPSPTLTTVCERFSIKENENILTNKHFILYPNPARAKIEIRLQISEIVEKGKISIQIYDLTGRVIRTLPISNPQSTITKIVWDGRDDDKKLLPSGIYFVKLNVGEFSQAKKLLLLLK